MLLNVLLNKLELKKLKKMIYLALKIIKPLNIIRGVEKPLHKTCNSV